MLKLLLSPLRALNRYFFIVAGIVLGCWVWAGVYETPSAFEFALWAAEQSPLQLTVPPLQLANEVIQPEALRTAAFVAISLLILGVVAELTGRARQRLQDQDRGGDALIVLKTEHPRVGGRLEGSLRLLAPPRPEQVYRVALFCRREYRKFADDRRDTVETPFFEQREIQVRQGAEGWSVPFRFDIPATAPPTDAVAFGGHAWQLTFHRADAVISFPTGITFNVDPALGG